MAIERIFQTCKLASSRSPKVYTTTISCTDLHFRARGGDNLVVVDLDFPIGHLIQALLDDTDALTHLLTPDQVPLDQQTRREGGGRVIRLNRKCKNTPYMHVYVYV